jgi:hypothetical protein
MALSKGFPPSNTISPSVRIAEKDLSFIAPEQTFHRSGLVGFASKGPINIPTLIASVRELHTVFGHPHPALGDPYLIYAAEQYLQVANELFVVRVADEDSVSDERAVTATVDVPVSGGRIVLTAGTTGPYTFAKDSFFKWKVNGIPSSKTLVVLAGTYTAITLAAALNEQLDTLFDGIIFANSAGKLQVSTTFAYGPDSDLELLSVQDAIYGAGSITGLGAGMTAASVTGTTDRYPNDSYHTAGTFDFTGLTALQLQVVVDGSGGQCGSGHRLDCIRTLHEFGSVGD